MKCAVLICVLALAVPAQADGVNPIQKVVQLINSLHKKVTAEGAQAHKLFNEFSLWCRDRSKELEFEIKTSESQKANLKAQLEKASDDIDSLGTRIEELSSAISSNEGDLKAATKIRNQEKAAFDVEQKELVDTIDSMRRAIGILRKAMAKGGSFVQMPGSAGLIEGFAVLVQGAVLDSADVDRLTALVQSSEQSGTDEDMSDADEEAFGAPTAAAYEGKSNTIIETLQGLMEKAQTQLEVSRQTEQSRTHNFDLLKQSLEDKIKASQQNMDEAKKALGGAGERKATAEGALSVTIKDLKEDMKALEDLHKECSSRSSAYEEERKTRAKELEALSNAKKVITETTGGATQQTYKDKNPLPAFLQVSSSHKGGRSMASRAIHIVRKLAWSRNSPMLMQLSDALDIALTNAGNSADPFAKVKKLISNMIAKLQKEAESESMHKAYCDKEMSETRRKKSDKDSARDQIVTKLDQLAAEVAKLEEEIAVLQKELAELVKSQAEMDRIRQESNSLFLKNKPEMEEAISGIQQAMKVLRDYYAKSDEDTSGTSGTGIIGLLEVAESDFSMRLSEIVESEQSAVAAYTKQTQDNRVMKAEKERDVTYKTKSCKAMEKTIAEFSSDRDGIQTELDAVNDYLAKLKEQCVAKAEPFEVRAQRRQAEINGLTEAMRALEGGAMLLQEGSSRRTLRGIQPHASSDA